MSAPRAVVFDLFGTLVSYPSGSRHVHAMADRLEIPYEVLRPAWSVRRARRDAGELDTIGTLRECCDELRMDRTDEDLRSACSEVVEFFREVLIPRDGALDVLTDLRVRGFRIGLVSDANLEVPKLWLTSLLAPLVDAAVFSSIEHCHKPDPRLYRAVCERLDVTPSACVYVGNGDGDELAGARAAGMRAILFMAPGEFPGREAEGWRGQRISSLAQLPALIDALVQQTPPLVAEGHPAI